MVFPNVQRNEGAIIVYLTPNQATPPCPPELRAHISEGDWTYRLSAVGRVVRRTSVPLFERIWFAFALLATFVAPIVIYHIVSNAIASKTNANFASTIVELHAMGFGVFLATCFLFWTPLAIWKAIGAIRVRKLMNGFEREDAARQPDIAYRPSWKVHLPGVFGTQTRISIALPLPPPMSYFNPNAELPPYIASYPPPAGNYPDSMDAENERAMQSMGYGDMKTAMVFDDEKTAIPRNFV